MRVARSYFGVQALAGVTWWIVVWRSDRVRDWTLGAWDPAIVAIPDLAFFVIAAAIAALTGNRLAAVISAGWTVLVCVALAIYGLLERAAGWGVVAMVLAATGGAPAAATIWFGRLPTRWFFSGPFTFRAARQRRSSQHVRRSLVQLVMFWTTFFVVIPFVLCVIERRLRLDWGALDHSWCVIVGLTSFVVGSGLGLWSCITMAVRGEGTHCRPRRRAASW